MPTLLTAGGLTVGAQIVSATDGALTLQTGPDGSKVNALAFAADGTPTFLKQPAAQIQPISASVGSNALTISAGYMMLDFRSTTLGSGTVTTVAGTPANLVISSGSTLGTVNAVQSRIVVLAINNAGTIELAAVNIAGGNQLDETNLISTTAEGGAGAADSASVIYSTTARSNVAYRVIGYVESTQATAGTWATAPSTVQGAGGNSMDAMQSIGYGQTWQSVTRTNGTTYYNTTGRPILLMASFASSSGANEYLVLTVNGVAINFIYAVVVSGVVFGQNSIIIPPGASYVFSGGTPVARSVYELR